MSTNVPEVKKLSDQEIISMLRDAATSPVSADRFFESFWYARELRQGNYSSAFDQGISLLLKCQSLDAHAYNEIHKGTPFYFLGTAAFLLHDYETAMFFYDAAVSEDLRAGVDPETSTTPALLFVQIDGEQQNQAALSLVSVAQMWVQDVINEYNGMPGRPRNVPDLTVTDLRAFFLRPAVSPGFERWRSLATAFISFFLEWHHRNALIDLRVGPGTFEPFFIHLFKGCVLFESLVQANPNHQISVNAQYLVRKLQSVHLQLGIPHNLTTREATFPSILQDLQDADNRIQTAIEFACKIRNCVGHELGWQVNLDKIQYHRLFRMVAISCLHIIACLYR